MAEAQYCSSALEPSALAACVVQIPLTVAAAISRMTHRNVSWCKKTSPLPARLRKRAALGFPNRIPSTTMGLNSEPKSSERTAASAVYRARPTGSVRARRVDASSLSTSTGKAKSTSEGTVRT